MSLKTEVFGLLDNIQRLCDGCEEAKSLAESVLQMRERLKNPLRVAVVGIMKAGKSTFMNALMGTDILVTGDLETTYTVCWFQYGEQPSLTVCFRDGSRLEAPFADLEKWSVRASKESNSKLDDVKHLIIYYPAEILKTLEFIDTPGLNSIYGTDAQNTLDFLSLQEGSKESKDTIYEAGMADAIIYAFSQSVRGFDQEIMKAFQNGNARNVSPINTVGILTKADATGIWSVFDDQTPVEKGRIVAENIVADSNLKQCLFTVLPVCAKACEGYAQLEDSHWNVLKKMAVLSREDIEDLLCESREFEESTEQMYMQIGTTEERKTLISYLGQYGIFEITRQLSLGKNEDEIGMVLQELCGIQQIRGLLDSHFANRTFLIKTQYIMNYLRSQIYQIKRDRGTVQQLLDICEQVEDEIDSLISSVQTLKELKALQGYYNGQLQFEDEDEVEDFLRITGEYGRSVEARLGVSIGHSVEELAEIARRKVGIWHGKAASGWMMSGVYVEAASIIARSYEQIFYHLNALCEE